MNSAFPSQRFKPTAAALGPKNRARLDKQLIFMQFWMLALDLNY